MYERTLLEANLHVCIKTASCMLKEWSTSSTILVIRHVWYNVRVCHGWLIREFSYLLSSLFRTTVKKNTVTFKCIHQRLRYSVPFKLNIGTLGSGESSNSTTPIPSWNYSWLADTSTVQQRGGAVINLPQQTIFKYFFYSLFLLDHLQFRLMINTETLGRTIHFFSISLLMKNA